MFIYPSLMTLFLLQTYACIGRLAKRFKWLQRDLLLSLHDSNPLGQLRCDVCYRGTFVAGFLCATSHTDS